MAQGITPHDSNIDHLANVFAKKVHVNDPNLPNSSVSENNQSHHDNVDDSTMGEEQLMSADDPNLPNNSVSENNPSDSSAAPPKLVREVVLDFTAVEHYRRFVRDLDQLLQASSEDSIPSDEALSLKSKIEEQNEPKDGRERLLKDLCDGSKKIRKPSDIEDYFGSRCLKGFRTNIDQIIWYREKLTGNWENSKLKKQEAIEKTFRLPNRTLNWTDLMPPIYYREKKQWLCKMQCGENYYVKPVAELPSWLDETIEGTGVNILTFLKSLEEIDLNATSVVYYYVVRVNDSDSESKLPLQIYIGQTMFTILERWQSHCSKALPLVKPDNRKKKKKKIKEKPEKQNPGQVDSSEKKKEKQDSAPQNKQGPMLVDAFLALALLNNWEHALFPVKHFKTQDAQSKTDDVRKDTQKTQDAPTSREAVARFKTDDDADRKSHEAKLNREHHEFPVAQCETQDPPTPHEPVKSKKKKAEDATKKAREEHEGLLIKEHHANNPRHGLNDKCGNSTTQNSESQQERSSHVATNH